MGFKHLIEEFNALVKHTLITGIVLGTGAVGMNTFLTSVNKKSEKVGSLLKERVTFDLTQSDLIHLGDNYTVDLSYFHSDDSKTTGNFEVYGTAKNGEKDLSFKAVYTTPEENIAQIMLENDIFKSYIKAIEGLKLEEINAELIDSRENNISTITNFLGSAEEGFDYSNPKFVKPTLFHPFFMDTNVIVENDKLYIVLKIDGLNIIQHEQNETSFETLLQNSLLKSDVYFRTDVLTLELIIVDEEFILSKEDAKKILLYRIEHGQTSDIVKQNISFSEKINPAWFTIVNGAVRGANNLAPYLSEKPTTQPLTKEKENELIL